MNINKLLSVPEVAELLGIQRETVYLWTHTKNLPHIKLGGRIIRFEQSAIKEWIQAQQEVTRG